jgi:hypothetical protein
MRSFVIFICLPSIIAILKQQGCYEGGVASSKCGETHKRRDIVGVIAVLGNVRVRTYS